LALAALVAAVFAYHAQAKAADELAKQVGIQSDQLKDQREANSKQAQVVDAQLREMQQRERIIERQQADLVTLTPSSTTVMLQQDMQLPPDADVFEALVFNGSHRPIRNVACRIELTPGESPRESDFVGLSVRAPGGHRLSDPAEGSEARLIRAEETWGFVFQHEFKRYTDARITLRFNDDARLHWQIDHDMSLTKLDTRDW
jgi:hypothetical protein